MMSLEEFYSSEGEAERRFFSCVNLPDGVAICCISKTAVAHSGEVEAGFRVEVTTLASHPHGPFKRGRAAGLHLQSVADAAVRNIDEKIEEERRMDERYRAAKPKKLDLSDIKL